MQDSNPSGPNNLLEVEAQSRAIQVANVKYSLILKLEKGSPTYKGDVTITFDYKKHEGNLFLDFVGKTIDVLSINDVTVTDPVFISNRILLGDRLSNGHVKVRVVYVNEYDHTGDGFHQFTDPEDGQIMKEYLYSNFEPFECHRLLPCFDQPNIKGELSLSVDAPSDWKVIANSFETSRDVDGERTFHKFESTPKISTYLFALVAGPYDEVRDSYEERVPLGIYVRKSLRKHLDSDNIFTQTKQGLKFYEEFFDYKYPFSKYDQLFVPEFNVGAMENVGCVTFTEHYIFKDPPTRSQVANRADTILHEMAHMWFGNLVSPVWWDGLWLNESFATYMAALCTAEATEFGNLSWQNFNSGMKEWAYREDQLSTTHPIQGKVVDTEATFLTFDGITYGKGASLLKQLVYQVGIDSFRKGMQYYFKKYNWGNTTITQFLDALQHANSSFNAEEWAKDWLQTSGLNTLELELNIADGKISKALVHQTAVPEHPTLREHYCEVVLYDLDSNGSVKQRSTHKIKFEKKSCTDITSLVFGDNQTSPSFAFLNNNDHSFVKCLLDQNSKNFVLEKLEKLTDPLLRQLLWSTLYQQTRDAKMKSTDFVKLVCEKIVFETDPKLVATILQRGLNSLYFVPNALRNSQAESLFNITFDQFKNAREQHLAGNLGLDFVLVWLRVAVGAASTSETVNALVKELKENDKLITQDMRWSIIVKAIAWAHPDGNKLLELEQEKDKSDTGDRAVRRAQAAVPTKEAKAKAWALFVDKNAKETAHQLAASMSGFMWKHQAELLSEYRQPFFDSVQTVFKERGREIPASFFGYLFPDDPEDHEILEKTNKLLSQVSSENEKHLTREIKEKLDDLNRSLKCRKLLM